MPTLPAVEPDRAIGPAADLLAGVKRRLGVVPNMTKVMANSPALLKGYVELANALSGGVLGVATGERLALAIAQDNRCSYCLSAHSYLAEHVAHLDEADIKAARNGDATDAKAAALLTFAVSVNRHRGDVTTTDVEAVRSAGATDQEIAETIGHVALNVLTNYFNKAAGVDIDFPIVEA